METLPFAVMIEITNSDRSHQWMQNLVWESLRNNRIFTPSQRISNKHLKMLINCKMKNSNMTIEKLADIKINIICDGTDWRVPSDIVCCAIIMGWILKKNFFAFVFLEFLIIKNSDFISLCLNLQINLWCY